MSNPVFTRSDVFGPEGRNRTGRTATAYGAPTANSSPTYGTPTDAPTGGPAWGTPPAATGAVDAAQLDAWYASPSAGNVDTDRLSWDDVVLKTAGLLALLVVAGAATWILAPGLWPIGLVVGLVLGFVNALRRTISPVLIMAYAVAEGVCLGGLSRFYESAWSGIVMQAVLATVATFAVTLALFASGKVRVTPRFTRFLMIAVGGYALFSLINLILMWTGVLTNPWGLRGATILGIPLGIVIGVVAVGLAAASLLVDFDSIKRGVESGVSRRYAWTAGFGLLVTLVWLYLEFLRLIAMARR